MGADATSMFRLHRAKVQAQARTLIEPAHDAELNELTDSFRRFLKIEMQRLRMAHESGAPGRQTAMGRSYVVDLVVQHAFRRAMKLLDSATAVRVQNSCAIIAVGGYGRGELAPFSDVDLLFLYSRANASLVKTLAANLLSLLWDAGLTVGHGFRTVGDCTTASLDDTHLRTALIHKRWLTGNRALHRSLCDALEKDRRRRSKAFLAAVIRECESRYRKFSDAVCLQEPNIKESAGGLRDYHTTLWLSHARDGYNTLEELRSHDLIREDEARRAISAYDFLWRVRHAAHFVTNRKTDRLSLDLQPVLARQFGYEAGRYSLASEMLMRDYYRHARELHRVGETVMARVVDDKPRGRSGWRKRSLGEQHEPYAIRNAHLHFDGATEYFGEKPLRVFNAFALAQAARVSFDPQLRQLLCQSMRKIGPALRKSEETSAAFLSLLRRRGRVGHVLRLMHETGLLSRVIPEFARISLLVQHDLYHHFTVDEHTLRAIELLDELHTSTDRHRLHLRGILEELDDPAWLYLALLLHDIGKGEGRSHIARGARLAERICTRLRLPEDAATQVVLLVKHHVAMAHLAQRRDLSEPRLIERFAAELGSLDTLNMLLLLTYADLGAVAPGVWTEWKATLLWDLYRRTRKVMTGKDELVLESATMTQFKEQIVAALQLTVPMSEVERHLALLPQRYQQINTAAAVATHLSMLQQMNNEGFAVGWARARNSTTELAICAPDRHGLFASLAGTLAANGVEIMSAELNTREDGIAIDTFVLRQAATGQSVEEHRYQAIEAALAKAVAGKLDVVRMIERWRIRNAPRRRSAIVPARRRSLPRVVCDNEVSASSTLIEVQAVDEAGLAYKVARALTELELEIVCARIATERSDALDVFYVTGADGLKLPEEMHESIEQAVCERLKNAISVEACSPQIAEKETHEKSRSDYQTASA